MSIPGQLRYHSTLIFKMQVVIFIFSKKCKKNFCALSKAGREAHENRVPPGSASILLFYRMLERGDNYQSQCSADECGNKLRQGEGYPSRGESGSGKSGGRTEQR